MSYSQLPIDVIHEILEGAPDFATLSAATRISKTHHEVFKAHPRSIVRAVAQNVVGHALHPAARLADYHRRCSQWDQSFQTRADISGLPDEDHFAILDFTKSPTLTPAMEQNAGAVRILRNFYSQRRKDRTSPKCVLDHKEALRFDRAMYRYWLWLEMVQENAVWKDEDPSDDDEDNDQETEPELRDEFVAIVKSLSSEELLEILHVSAFVVETRLWRASWATPLSTFHTSSVDPASLARSLTDMDYSGSFNYVTWDPIQEFIKDVLLSRNVKPEQLHDKISNAIVTTVIGAGDKCSRCQAVRDGDLLGAQNMFLLTGLFPIRERISLLPGLLPRNGEETRLIESNILRPRASDREKSVFHEIVDLEVESVDDDAPAEEQWSKDEWYCLACIKELYRQRFLPWWKKTRQGDGSPTKDDCWYGYNCRTMTHRPAHASKLNSQQTLVEKIYALVSARPAGLCNFLDAPELEAFLKPPKGDDGEKLRVVYRSYATLYFVFVVDSAESELGILDLIQVFVESLDGAFENVCELDLVFHFDEAHHILAEIIQGGLVLETNVNEIDRAVQDAAKARKESFASANPLSLTGGGAVGSRGAGLQTPLGWLTGRLTGVGGR
ncbi:hypothetical protein GSI_08280 [Ganoderma sinense ZZ0214-1]|uniref:AP complex mu/sigma subunit domain-containing protein n=1 Tax=Ganoderma sinense ZZ0214-1 TaxID=1077348 RepID=A0A2G8S794_9APHY|nr:hypothetical protein GSI_08280 [Ganoderma sinense ZZ0214-1]